MEIARRRYRHRAEKIKEKVPYSQKVTSQLIACLIILLALFGIKQINNQNVQSVTKSVKTMLYYTIDYKGTAKNIISFVKTIPQKWNTLEKENEKNEENTNVSEPQEPVFAD